MGRRNASALGREWPCIERTIDITRRLMLGESISVHSLSARYGVTRRQAYRIIDAFTVALPLEIVARSEEDYLNAPLYILRK